VRGSNSDPGKEDGVAIETSTAVATRREWRLSGGLVVLLVAVGLVAGLLIGSIAGKDRPDTVGGSEAGAGQVAETPAAADVLGTQAREGGVVIPETPAAADVLGTQAREGGVVIPETPIPETPAAADVLGTQARESGVVIPETPAAADVLGTQARESGVVVPSFEV
jgi:hypothetical protein